MGAITQPFALPEGLTENPERPAALPRFRVFEHGAQRRLHAPALGKYSAQDYFQSRGGCSRPHDCGAAVLNRRPTSVLPPCFSPSYTTRQVCSLLLRTFPMLSLPPTFTNANQSKRHS